MFIILNCLFYPNPPKSSTLHIEPPTITLEKLHLLVCHKENLLPSIVYLETQNRSDSIHCPNLEFSKSKSYFIFLRRAIISQPDKLIKKLLPYRWIKEAIYREDKIYIQVYARNLNYFIFTNSIS